MMLVCSVFRLRVTGPADYQLFYVCQWCFWVSGHVVLRIASFRAFAPADFQRLTVPFQTSGTPCSFGFQLFSLRLYHFWISGHVALRIVSFRAFAPADFQRLTVPFRTSGTPCSFGFQLFSLRLYHFWISGRRTFLFFSFSALVCTVFGFLGTQLYRFSTFGYINQLIPELCEPFLGKNEFLAYFFAQNLKNGTKKLNKPENQVIFHQGIFQTLSSRLVQY